MSNILASTFRNAAFAVPKLDSTFNGSGSVSLSRVPHVIVTDPTVDTDQLIYLVGHGTASPDVDSWIERRRANGERDTDFGINGHLDFPLLESETRAKIEIQGMIFNANGITCVGVTAKYKSAGVYLYPAAARITMSGQLDSNFGEGGAKIYDIPYPASMNTNVADTPNASSAPSSIKVLKQEDDAILFFCETYNTHDQRRIYYLVKIKSDGALDPSFGEAGLQLVDSFPSSDAGYWSDYGVDDRGSITLVGRTALNTARLGIVARYRNDGRLDPGYGEAGKLFVDLEGSGAYIQRVIVSSDGGTTLFAVLKESGEVDKKIVVMKRLPYGDNDMTFNGGVPVVAEISTATGARVEVGFDLGGRIIIWGQDVMEQGLGCLLRMMPNGTMDSGFGENGVAVLDDFHPLNAGSLQDGKHLIVTAMDHRPFPERFLVRFLGEEVSGRN